MTRIAFQLLALQFILIASAYGLFGSKPKMQNTVKYKLQQKVLTLGSSYTVKNDKDQPVYAIGFKQLGLGKHLRLTDVKGQHEYFSIKHILNPLGLATYQILEQNKVVADVKRKFSIAGKKFSVKSTFGSYNIEGNFRSREFKIKKGPKLVATISKKFFAVGDQYGVKVETGENVPFILCLAIVVDEVAHG